MSADEYQVTMRGRQGLSIYENVSGSDAEGVTRWAAGEHRRLNREEPTEWTCTRLNEGTEGGRRTWSGR
jgi:hypothetical protein